MMMTSVYLLLVMVLGLVVVAAVTERLGCGADVFVLLLACMMLVLQFVHLGLFGLPGYPHVPRAPPSWSTCGNRCSSSRSSKEAFAEGGGGGGLRQRERAKQRAIDEGAEDVSTIEAGLT